MIDISRFRDVLMAINAILNDGDIAEVKKERIGIAVVRNFCYMRGFNV